MQYDVNMLKKLTMLAGIAIVSLMIFWAPFLIRIDEFWGIEFPSTNSGQVGMETIVQNFDGLNYLVVAKSLYKPEVIEKINQSFLTGNDPLYFTAHYPGLPLIIRLLDNYMTGPQAILASIIISNLLLTFGLYLFYLAYAKKSKLAGYLTVVALFLPARMLSDRMVGSNEPMFMALVFLSLYLASRKRYWLSAVAGSLSIVTRSPGILLFGGYVVSTWLVVRGTWQEKIKRLLPYLLMPLTLVGVWMFYGYQHGNLLAYFQSGVSMNIHFPPFSVFGTNQEWVSGMWREEIIYIYLLFGLGLLSLKNKLGERLDFARMATLSYGVIYLISILFVAHRDVARYSLPIAPLVILGFESYLDNVWVKRLLLILVIPIYLLGWQFVLQNVQPVADWSGLL